MEWLFPASILYAGVQSYTVYHVFSSPKKLRQPKSAPLEISAEEEELAASRKRIIESVLSIYQLKYTQESFEVMAENVSFEDPAVYFKGLNSLKNALNLAKSFIRSSETLEVDVHHFKNELRIDVTQRYKYRLGLAVTVSSALYLKLKGEPGQEKVVAIVEEWGKKCLLNGQNTPCLLTGSMATMFRKVHGRVCDLIRVYSRH